MSEVLELSWLIVKIVLNIAIALCALGLALGFIEIRRTDRWR